MNDRPPRVLLARHGETDDNLEPIRAQGFRDTPLNDTGRRQAAELAERLARDGIVSLWSSDLSRARETAEIVGARIGLEPRLDARLREGEPRPLGGAAVRRHRARASPSATRRGAARASSSGFPGASRCASSSERVARRAGAMCTPPASCRRWSSVTAARSASMLCARDPRGLDAFHEFDVPNVAVVAL